MKTFKSSNSYWDFVREVRNENRYFYSDKNKEFLDALLETSISRQRSIPKDYIFWRAQLGSDFRDAYDGAVELPCPYKADRMKPSQSFASEGRANPKGIPHLYLATTKETAMAEVRPWLDPNISISQFKLQEDLKIINFSKDVTSVTRVCLNPTGKQKEKAVWGAINRAFSIPINPTDNSPDYISTQIISELFRKNGFDGIAYKSSLERGHNIMLFDIEKAEPINCELYNLKKLSFEFKKSDDMIFYD